MSAPRGSWVDPAQRELLAEVRGSLRGYTAEHLARKRTAREASLRWLGQVRRHLDVAARFLGSTTPVAEVTLADVEAYVGWLLTPRAQGGRGLAPATANRYLSSLSNLFRRAASDGLVEVNPVTLLLRRPSAGPPAEPEWLEPDEVARLLAWARARGPRRKADGVAFLHELVALFAYSGLRKSEGLGLEVGDLDFARGLLRVRPNRWRSFKTAAASRVVPLFSELEAVLRAYLEGPLAPRGRLLFPSPAGRGSEERPLTNLRRALAGAPLPDRLAPPGTVPAEERGRLTLSLLRHTYCAARLQTTDRGAPVAPFTVAREMGHTEMRMVLRVYGHLGRFRLRGGEVRYVGSGGREGRAAEAAGRRRRGRPGGWRGRPERAARERPPEPESRGEGR